MRRVDKGLVNELPLKTQWPTHLPVSLQPERKCIWSTNSHWEIEMPSQSLYLFQKITGEINHSPNLWWGDFRHWGGWVERDLGAVGRVFRLCLNPYCLLPDFLHCLVSLSSVNYLIGGWVNACPEWKLDILSTLTDLCFNHFQQNHCFWPQIDLRC